MFKKFDVNFDNINLNNLLGSFVGNSYSRFGQYNIKNHNYLNSLINSKIKFKIEPDHIHVIKILPPGISPHTDASNSSLIIYITAGNDKTYFYKNPYEEGLRTEIYGTRSYHGKKNMEVIGSFTANEGDCYLIDTHTAHSVEVKNQARYLLRFVWVKNTFQEIENNINIIS